MPANHPIGVLTAVLGHALEIHSFLKKHDAVDPQVSIDGAKRLKLHEPDAVTV